MRRRNCRRVRVRRRETLDSFAKALLLIAAEDPQLLHDAPHTTPISRPDEVKAAKTPVLKWTPG